ncbi:hypothetical protein Tco_0990872 [Tanacetum coccineum]|uniref:Uncharacterized protein n=1 Tax=Tanacetum coccineum TaxID=301880 RepID=A0ABQ5EYG1_9ASTR
MAAYQRMIAGTDPTQREEALTVYGMETGQSSVPVPETVLTVCTARLRGQLHTILEDMDCAVGLTRWFEKLESPFGISNVVEGDRVKFTSSTLLDGALTWWNMYVRFCYSRNPLIATPFGVNFSECSSGSTVLSNEVKQMENELWNFQSKGTNLNRLQSAFSRTHPLMSLIDLQEAIEWHQGLMYQRQQGLFNIWALVPMLANYLTAESMDDTTLTHALLLVTTVEGQDIRSKTAELHLVPRAKEDLEAKEDREVMLLASDVVRRDITRTSVRIMESKAVETQNRANQQESS